MTYKIILTDWQTHQADLSNIRTAVFIQEQKVPEADEWDEFDKQAIHFLVQNDNNEFIGCARLLIEKQQQNAVFHIGRVAIVKSFRNQGIGHSLMRFIVDYCHSSAAQRRIYLHAQIERRHFYTTLGFIAEGNEFMDAGIPHISMYLTSASL